MSAAAHAVRVLLLLCSATLAPAEEVEGSEGPAGDDVALLVAPNGALHRVEHQRRRQRAFDEFVAEHGLAYHEGHPEREMRLSLFEAWAERVEQHNARTDVNWRAGINGLAAHTSEELARLQGYVRGSERTEGTVSMPGAGRLSMLEVPSRPSRVEDLPASFGWQGKLNATSSVLDQKGCGSCWAVSSVTALRAHSELFQHYRHFSIQQVLSCAPNPHKCGGAGGCSGATSEIAMDYAAKIGLLTEDEFPYTGKDDECPSEVRMPEEDALDVDLAGTATSLLGYSEGAEPGMDAKPGMGAKSGLVGFHKLASNRVADLMLSLHNLGPVVVSISAAGWGMYKSGVYDSCRAGDIINHAVVLVGYGKDAQSGLKYWHIQNSWGASWGEQGFMRMGRLDDEEANCGWDMQPLQGSGCEGGPPKAWTCGSCGILFDAVAPRFVESKSGWWARQGGASD